MSVIAPNKSSRWYRPIKTRKRRRVFVILNWTFVLLLFCGMLMIAIRNHPISWNSWSLVYWIVVGTTLFGGLQYGGPVKKFENPKLDSAAGYKLYKSMNPTIWKQRGMPAWANDEFDLQRRNAAHYAAYRILRWVYPAIAAALWLLSRDPDTSVWAARILEAALLPSVLAFLWLPQTIILWTEPDWSEETAAGPQLVDANDH